MLPFEPDHDTPPAEAEEKRARRPQCPGCHLLHFDTESCASTIRAHLVRLAKTLGRPVILEHLPPTDSAAAQDVAGMMAIVRRVLVMFGKSDNCRACRAVIYWLQHASGAKAPYTEYGLNHFADCPKAERFQGGRR
jgi:hypothetical protein